MVARRSHEVIWRDGRAACQAQVTLARELPALDRGEHLRGPGCGGRFRCGHIRRSHHMLSTVIMRPCAPDRGKEHGSNPREAIICESGQHFLHGT